MLVNASIFCPERSKKLSNKHLHKPIETVDPAFSNHLDFSICVAAEEFSLKLKLVVENFFQDHYSDRCSFEVIVMLRKGNEVLDEFTASDHGLGDELKIGILGKEEPSSSLLNAACSVATGKILCIVPNNRNALAGYHSFILNEMNDFKNNVGLYFSKWFDSIDNLAFYKSTFFDLGGFDERIKEKNRIPEFISRMKKRGILIQRVGSDYFEGKVPIRSPFTGSGMGTFKQEKKIDIKWV